MVQMQGQWIPIDGSSFYQRIQLQGAICEYSARAVLVMIEHSHIVVLRTLVSAIYSKYNVSELGSHDFYPEESFPR